jgi:hypothetical protein
MNLSITGDPKASAKPQLSLNHHKLDLCATCTLQLTGVTVMFDQQESQPTPAAAAAAAAAAAGSSHTLPPGGLVAAVVVPVVVAGVSLQATMLLV